MGEDRVRCAIVGYGPAFNWGYMHARWIGAIDELALAAICDRDPNCAARARADFPQVQVYTDLSEMLRDPTIEMVTIVTPHNTHAPLAIKCLEAGKHTVVEKPMCITTDEATKMIEAANRAGKTLAVFHNRRHDGNVRAIQQAIAAGLIGDVFHIEYSSCNYGPNFTFGRPGDPWRADKQASGGGFYDIGAHAVDWVLWMVPSRMTEVTGFFHKLVWHEFSCEDQTRAIIRFENGCVADILVSRIAYARKPAWYILGTKGAIVDTAKGATVGYVSDLKGPAGGAFTLINAQGERQVPYMESDWLTHYRDLADHILRGAPVPVSGEDGRRVVAVLETAEKSAQSGHSEHVLYP